MNTVIITGASSGLGKCFFDEICKKYKDIDEIWLIARRKERLEKISEGCGVKTRILPLDLSLDTSLKTLSDTLEEAKPNVKILINNSGFGKLGNVEDEDYASQAAMVDVNCKALTAISTMCLKYMKKGSFIVNVCSIASFAPNPRMTVYSSTKAYVMSYSRGLRFELKQRGINVLAVCPGPMDTEFLSVADIYDKSKTFNTLPRCVPQEVAKGALKSAEKGKSVYTNKFFYKFYRVFAKLLPHSFVMQLSKT